MSHVSAQSIVDANKSPYYRCRCLDLRETAQDPNKNSKCEIHIFPNVKRYGNIFSHIENYLSSQLDSYNNMYDEEFLSQPYDSRYLWYHVKLSDLNSILEKLNDHLNNMKLTTIDVTQMHVNDILDELSLICMMSSSGRELIQELRRRNMSS